MAGELRYHYTSVEALFEIVERKRFRISNILFMNDYFEFRWLWRLVQEQITERQRCDPDHRSNLYLKHLQSQMDHLLGWNSDRDGGIVPNVFCGCFSIKDNDLNQWRQYADDGRGVVIGVDLASVKSENERCDKRKVEVADVTYRRDEQLQWVAARLDDFINHAREYDVETEPSEEVRVSNIIQTSLGFCMELAYYAPIFKSEAFESESEVRLIVRSPPHFGSPVKDFKIDPLPKDVDYYFGKGRIMPCVYLAFPPEAIDRITLGPTFGGVLEQSALQGFLLKHGVREQVVQEIKRSDLSYHGRPS